MKLYNIGWYDSNNDPPFQQKQWSPDNKSNKTFTLINLILNPVATTEINPRYFDGNY